MPVHGKPVIEFPSVLDRAYKESKRHLKVGDIMSRRVITTTPETPMIQAAKTMGEKHIGSLIVVKFRTPVAIVTERDLLSKVLGTAFQSFVIINLVSLIVSIIITTVVLFIVITIKTLNSRRQIGILKAIGVDKEVIMHNYGFQVIILAIFGIILGIIVTLLLAVYMSIHPVTTPAWSATLYLTPMDLLMNSLILFVAAIVAGYVPAYQVSREDIQTAMRA